MSTKAETSLSDDIAFMEQLADATGLRSARQALDRIKAIVDGLPHLEEAARLLRSSGCVFTDGWIKHSDWLKADRLRRRPTVEGKLKGQSTK